MRAQAQDETKHAVDERDFAGTVFLDWFVEEQVEEEKTSGLGQPRSGEVEAPSNPA